MNSSFKKSDNPDSSESNSDNQSLQVARIEPVRRIIALLIDFSACYLIAILSCIIPVFGRFIEMQLVLALALIARDCIFEGRGIGKNLMGLKVVDADTGLAPTLRQSIIRNVVLTAPFFIFLIASMLAHIIHADWFNSIIMSSVSAVCTIYVAIVLPYECFRAYTRQDGRRKGDELAHTEIVESSMDFSHFLPNNKS